MRRLNLWIDNTPIILCAVVVIGTAFAPSSSAQLVSGPSTQQPTSPFQLRDNKSHLSRRKLSRWKEGDALWNDLAQLLADVNQKVAEKKLGSLNPKTIGNIRAKQLTVLKIGHELETMGETAGVEMQHRARWAEAQLVRIKEELRQSPSFIRKIDGELKSLQSKAARYDKILDDVKSHVKRENWDIADKMIQKMSLDLESRAIWVNHAFRKRHLRKFDLVRGSIRAGRHAELRRSVGRTLGEKFNDNVPDLDKYARWVDEKIESIKTDGSAELPDGTVDGITVDGPELLDKINILWRRMQVATLQMKALNWVRVRNYPQATASQRTLETQYDLFNKTISSAMVRLINADAARADADEAARLYPKYLRAVAPLLARGNDPQAFRTVSKALDALLAKSPQLTEDVAAYRLATDDVLRWRRRAAADRAAHRRADVPALAQLTRTAFLPDKPSGASGLTGISGGLPLLLGRAAPNVAIVSKRMIGQPIHRGPMTGSGAGDARRYSSRLERRTLSQVTRPVDLDPAVARLKRDLLLVDDDALPLSLEAAVAIFKADRGDLAAVGGQIEDIELISLINCVAATEAEEPYLLHLGQLPRYLTASGQPTRALIVRIAIKPTWVQHDYFFVDLDKK
jgi:hypothetical protein